MKFLLITAVIFEIIYMVFIDKKNLKTPPEA